MSNDYINNKPQGPLLNFTISQSELGSGQWKAKRNLRDIAREVIKQFEGLFSGADSQSISSALCTIIQKGKELIQSSNLNLHVIHIVQHTICRLRAKMASIQDEEKEKEARKKAEYEKNNCLSYFAPADLPKRTNFHPSISDYFDTQRPRHMGVIKEQKGAIQSSSIKEELAEVDEDVAKSLKESSFQDECIRALSVYKNVLSLGYSAYHVMLLKRLLKANKDAPMHLILIDDVSSGAKEVIKELAEASKDLFFTKAVDGETKKHHKITVAQVSSMYQMIPQVDAVYLAGNGIAIDGGVTAPVGANLLTQTAKFMKKPVFVSAPIVALSNLPLPVLYKEEKIMPSSISGDTSNKLLGFEISIPRCDPVSRQYISWIITDGDLFHPEEMCPHAKKYYHPDDYTLSTFAFNEPR